MSGELTDKEFINVGVAAGQPTIPTPINKKKNDYTSIMVKRETKNELDTLKVSPSESYNDVLNRLIKYAPFRVVDGMIILSQDGMIKETVKK